MSPGPGAGTSPLFSFILTLNSHTIMSGIRETRKKLQRSVLYIIECEKADSALHELTLLKQTVDSQVELLSKKLNLQEETDDAPDTEATDASATIGDQDVGDPVAEAAKQGFNTLYTDTGEDAG